MTGQQVSSLVLNVAVTYLEVSREVDIPADVVWEVLTDTRYWPSWGPSVTAVRCDPPHIEKGSTGQVKTTLGFWVPFSVTDFQLGCFWSWKVAGVPATGHRVIGLPQNRCRIIFQIPLWAWPYALVCKRALKRIARTAYLR